MNWNIPVSDELNKLLEKSIEDLNNETSGYRITKSSYIRQAVIEKLRVNGYLE